ncbi:MAG: hypothetical protein ACUZ8H_03195 [Candidatus Anammoxibacter sp.]
MKQPKEKDKNLTYYDKHRIFIFINGYLDVIQKKRVFTYRIDGVYYVPENKQDTYNSREEAKIAAIKDADDYMVKMEINKINVSL